MTQDEINVDFLARERPRDEAVVEFARGELAELTPSDRERLTEKFIAAAMSAVPWLGSIVSTGLALKNEGDALRRDNLLRVWLEEHQSKLRQLYASIDQILERFATLWEVVKERLQDKDYLQLVRRTFRAWDRADTEEKRRYAANLVVNAAGTRLCTDDVVRLFIDLLDSLHEIHLAFVYEIYNNKGITRRGIWTNIYGNVPRENSAEADLFRLIIRDLSTGGLIRQHRETTERGDFVRQRPTGRRGPASPTLGTSFDNEDGYELTAFGEQFVRYVMTDIVGQIEAPKEGR